MKSASKATLASLIYRELEKLYPDAHCELDFKNPFQLLIATILSAQCTDKRVNIVTKDLFKVLKKPADGLKISQEALENIIRTTGFFRNKAKSILGACRVLSEDYGGEVPRTMEELVQIPGVGRKTANVVLGNAFNLPGLPCDTHVIRLSNRLGLTKSQDAVQVEKDLMPLFKPEQWCNTSHLLIWHGRRCCAARKPDCERCPLVSVCPAARRITEY